MRLLCIALAIASLWSAGVLVGTGEASGSPRETESRFDIEVTPEMKHHSRIRDILYFVGSAYQIGVLLLILTTRWSARLRDAALRVAHRPFTVAVSYFVLFAAVASLLEFPLRFYGGFIVPHQFGLTSQSFLSWLGDLAKETAVTILVGALIAALVLLAIHLFRRWWVAVWLGSIPVMIFLVVIAPVAFDPLFNRFEPLRDQLLRQRILRVAERAGIEESRVYQVDKSRQTKTMNAYVTGIGPTKRIVLWDTLLQKLTHDEIVAVMGHEIAHYVRHHLWKGLAFGVLVSMIVCWLSQLMYASGLDRFGGRWAINGHADPAAIPYFLAIVFTLLFFLAPAINAYSRRLEHQADRYGIELTGLNEAAASSFVKFAKDSKVNPDPHPFIKFWRYSHPPLAERVEFARRYGREDPRRHDR